jgi:hypothetical protein
VIEKDPATGVHVILVLLLLLRREPAGLSVVGRISIAFSVILDILASLSALDDQVVT